MRTWRIISIVGVSCVLAVGLSACGKKVETPVNQNANTNVNENENINAEVPDVNANSNENVNADANSNGNTNAASNTNVSGSDDLDDDGLNNDQERLNKTDPLNPDTDGDGYKDGIEVATGYDPTKIPEEDPKVISQLKPVNTPGLPKPVVRSTPLRAAQSFPFRATKADGQVTTRLESKVAISIVNFALDFAGGEENRGPSLNLDNKYSLLTGNYDKGKVWMTGRDFTKGAHFMSTNNTVGTLTVFPAPTPPYSIDGRGEGGVEDSGVSYNNTFVGDFPQSGTYKLEFGVTKGKAKISVENTNLVQGDKVYTEVESIKSVTLTADVAEGLHTITIQSQGLTNWSLRVSKS